MRRLLMTVLVAVLTVTMSTVGATAGDTIEPSGSAEPASTATPTTTSELAEPTVEVSDLPVAVVKGETIQLTVITDPLAVGATARLERRTAPDGGWGTIRTATLDEFGSTIFTAKPNSYNTFDFRVVVDTNPALVSRVQSVQFLASAAAVAAAIEAVGDDSVVVTDLPTTLAMGDTLELTVTTDPALAGVTARFERRPQGSTWSTIGTAALDEAGSATFTARPNAYKTFDFRVAIDASPTIWSRTQSVRVVEAGSVTPPPPPGTPSGEGVTVTVTDLPTTLVKGQTLTLVATTDPALAGVTARFQRRPQGSTWGTIATRAIDINGQVTFTAKPNAYKTFDFRVALDTDPVVLSRVQSVRVVAGGTTSGFTPTNSALFNNPFGVSSAKHRLSLRMEAAINATPPGETIRLAMFSFSRPQSLRALIAAYNRGVNVQVVLNDHDITDEIKRLRQVLGTNPSAPSFVQICDSGCRVGGNGNQHMKFLAFTKTGGVAEVLMVTSGNLTYAGGAWQWNDLITIVGRSRLYQAYTEIFDELKRDQRVGETYRYVSEGPYVTEFFPTSAGRANDPIWRELSRIRCRGATDGTGRNGRTVVQVSMWSWSGDRGMYLASKLRELDADGCYVEVVVGAPSATVLRELRRTGPNGGIAVRDSRKDYQQVGYYDEPSYTKGAHHKYLLISGVYAGASNARHVLTGSLNWTTGALLVGDELTLQTDLRTYHGQYQRNFSTMFNNRTYTSILRNY